MLTLAFVGFVVFASLWITFIDFAELGRYFFLLVALFVLFGLFYVPALHTLFFEALVGGAMLALLKSAGLFSHIQGPQTRGYSLLIYMLLHVYFSLKASERYKTMKICNNLITNPSDTSCHLP